MSRVKLSLKLLSDEFSCQRVQSQTYLSYVECSRKSHVCKMYETFSISHEQSKLTLKLSSTMYERLNKQAKFLTSQYIGTCKSAYTKGYALN